MEFINEHWASMLLAALTILSIGVGAAIVIALDIRFIKAQVINTMPALKDEAIIPHDIETGTIVCGNPGFQSKPDIEVPECKLFEDAADFDDDGEDYNEPPEKTPLPVKDEIAPKPSKSDIDEANFCPWVEDNGEPCLEEIGKNASLCKKHYQRKWYQENKSTKKPATTEYGYIVAYVSSADIDAYTSGMKNTLTLANTTKTKAESERYGKIKLVYTESIKDRVATGRILSVKITREQIVFSLADMVEQ